MKKLMIAAAIVCAAVVSQGAAILWEGGDIYDFVGPTAISEEFNTGYAAYWIDSAAYSLANAQKDIADGKLGFLTGKSEGFANDGYVDSIEVGGYADGADVTGYMVIVNAADAADATYAFVTDEMTKSIGDKGQSANFVYEFDSSNGADWTKVGNVPEPTSGLLLLLGVAGLALKRRRA